MDLGLKGKVAVVLASSKGLGKASALALAQEGCKVALCARDRRALEAAAREIQAKTNSPVFALPADVEDPREPARFVEAVLKRFRALHILVFNNGGPPPGKGLDLPEEAWERAARSTLLPAVRWTRAAVKPMIRQKWGRILFIESISIKQPIDGLVLSNTMRPGVAGFAKSMARELAPHGILVNTLTPGSHATDRLKANMQARARARGTSLRQEFKRLEAEIPLGRLGVPKELGAVVAFLASEKASYVTGAVIQVDGGACRGTL